MWLSIVCNFFFLMIRRPPRSTLDRSSAASDVYKRQDFDPGLFADHPSGVQPVSCLCSAKWQALSARQDLSLIHISEPTRPY